MVTTLSTTSKRSRSIYVYLQRPWKRFLRALAYGRRAPPPPSPPFKDKAPSADEEAQTSHTERRHKSPSSSPRVPCLSSPSPLLPPRVSSSNSRPRAGRGTLGLGHLTLDPNLHSRADLILPLRFFLAVLNPSSHPRPASSNRNN